jgi:hypothetical protein
VCHVTVSFVQDGVPPAPEEALIGMDVEEEAPTPNTAVPHEELPGQAVPAVRRATLCMCVP